jgi:hypothetical protein
VDRDPLYGLRRVRCRRGRGSDPRLPSGTRHRGVAPRSFGACRADRAGSASGRRRFFQGHNPAQRDRRSRQRRHPAAHRFLDRVRASPDSRSGRGTQSRRGTIRRHCRNIADRHRVGARVGSNRRVRACLHRGLSGRRSGVCWTWSLRRDHLRNRHSRNRCRLSAGGDRRRHPAGRVLAGANRASGSGDLDPVLARVAPCHAHRFTLARHRR